MTVLENAGTPPRRIIVGVGAGIAAYKVTGVVRQFTKAGDTVRVIPTQASLNFVGQTTWQALSGGPANTDVFDGDIGVDHVEAARDADLIVIAPATADLIAKIRAGIASDLLTTTVLAATCPVVVVPAMHTAMWENPATQDNIGVLKDRGMHVLEPEVGDLSSGDRGAGRMPEPEAICEFSEAVLAQSGFGGKKDLTGVRAFVTAGGTREPIDPVRFIGNHSSGKQGAAIAQALTERGADVTVFAANIDTGILPSGVTVISTPSAIEMYEAVQSVAGEFDLGFFVAAVADFRPAQSWDQKVKKSSENADGWALQLVRNPDILRETASRYPHLLCFGFAAETGDEAQVLEFGKAKARRKGARYIAINQVGIDQGFGTDTNRVSVVDGAGTIVLSVAGTKLQVARELVDLAAVQLVKKN